jgi:hypothetical protein
MKRRYFAYGLGLSSLVACSGPGTSRLIPTTLVGASRTRWRGRSIFAYAATADLKTFVIAHAPTRTEFLRQTITGSTAQITIGNDVTTYDIPDPLAGSSTKTLPTSVLAPTVIVRGAKFFTSDLGTPGFGAATYELAHPKGSTNLLHFIRKNPGPFILEGPGGDGDGDGNGDGDSSPGQDGCPTSVGGVQVIGCVVAKPATGSSVGNYSAGGSGNAGFAIPVPNTKVLRVWRVDSGRSRCDFTFHCPSVEEL